ncbi:MAG: hypothetical protein AAGF77_01485 [Bacteroidota bacterium]
MTPKQKWRWTGGIATALIGAGICAIVECAFYRWEGAPWYYWVPLGTAALIIFILGLVLLVKAGWLEHDWKTRE